MSKKSTFRRTRLSTGGKIGLALCVVAALFIAAVVLFTPSTEPNTPDPSGSDPSGGSNAPLTTVTTTQAPPPELSAETVAQLESGLTAHNVLLYDATNRRILYAKNSDESCYPASLTKLMTAATAAKYAGENATFTVGKETYLCDAQASKAYLSMGTTLSLEGMMQALLLPSGSDAAYCLAVTTARNVYPEEELSHFQAAMRFCDLMNQTAAEIGATASYFVNPDGMYHTNHVTTAEDMLKIVQYALSFDSVRQAFTSPTATVTAADGTNFSWTNTNRLLNRNTAYYYAPATGGKTGYTDEAGYCLAATAEKDGVQLISLVFGCSEQNDRFSESATLFRAGFALYGIDT